MKLLTKQLEKRFKELGSQENSKDPICVAKFFNPTGSGTWFACDYIPEERKFFGYVSIFGDSCDEYGYFSLSELENWRGDFGLGIERDLNFEETPMSVIIKQYPKL